MKNYHDAALKYHSLPYPGKLSVIPSKPCATSEDLSLAYTPGVAEPCLEIEKHPDLVYEYTNKGNCVAVISNGTAVLGLGDIGAMAGKPVMEGKGVLFKRFADIDVFDIELNTKDPLKMVEIIYAMEGTFGGINLEDIKAPECFYIEEELIKKCSIPIFHDDQHGTAIISLAGFINALEIACKKKENVNIVFNGAGAAGIACAKLYLQYGIKKEQLIFCDSKGVIYEGRTDGMNPYKQEFAVATKFRTLEDAMKNADVFVGVSAKDCVTVSMLKSMNNNPIVFAMANPDPEIDYEAAIEARNDIIMATGRSDYPNQINNVLGFPFIFRGVMDVRATKITNGMKLAAANALALLAREKVPSEISKAYNEKHFEFGPEYIVPKPFDPRVIEWESVAVAKQACDEKLAKKNIKNWDHYKNELRKRMEKYWL